MLSGIGGRTIAEAQQRLSYTEFQSWAAFRKLRGSLHVGMRLEYGFAQMLTMYANSKSKYGGYRLCDFMPHQPEQPITLEEAMKSWG